MENSTRTQMKINLKKNQNSSVFNVNNVHQSNQGVPLGSRNGATSPFFVRKSDRSSNSSHDGKSSGSAGGSPPTQKRNNAFNQRFNQMSINDLKSEKFSTPNSIIKERFFGSQNPNYNNYNQQQAVAPANVQLNRFGQNTVVKPNANNRLAQADYQDAQKIQQQALKIQQQAMVQQVQETATADSKAMQTLQQIQEAKPGNKRAILTDLPEYLYSIPALASFFEPYGEVAMLQILPMKRMWDGDLIDLLGGSMCSRLAEGTHCAVVEFYSARMAKFIIGILRKRLPVLKFRCALLKPSAAIELTNQADNLGLPNAIKLRHIPTQSKDNDKKVLSDSENGSSGCAASHTVESDSEHSGINSKLNLVGVQLVGPVETPVVSSEESGMDELSSSNNQTESNLSSSSSCNESEPEVERTQPTDNQAEDSQQPDNQRFVTSFRIQLNR